MLIIIESQDFSLLPRIIDQLVKDFESSNPKSTWYEETRNLEAPIKHNGGTCLVTLKEPYDLVDCLVQTKETRNFIHQVYEYLHEENHHIAISIHSFKIISQRLRQVTRVKVLARQPGVFAALNLKSGQRSSGLLTKDNLWEKITKPDFNNPEEEFEHQEMDLGAKEKVLITIDQNYYLVKPEEPFILPDGRTLTITLPSPDLPEVLL